MCLLSRRLNLPTGLNSGVERGILWLRGWQFCSKLRGGLIPSLLTDVRPNCGDDGCIIGRRRRLLGDVGNQIDRIVLNWRVAMSGGVRLGGLVFRGFVVLLSEIILR